MLNAAPWRSRWCAPPRRRGTTRRDEVGPDDVVRFVRVTSRLYALCAEEGAAPARQFALCDGCGVAVACFRCGGCRAAAYCRAECQGAHWRAGHRTRCAAGPAAEIVN